MATILYIDDLLCDKIILDGYRSIINSHNHVLHTATDGKKGLEILAKETIDLLFLDLNMPVMNGDEVLNELKRQQSNIPVVMCSSNCNVRRVVERTGYDHIIGYCSHLSEKNFLKYLSSINTQN